MAETFTNSDYSLKAHEAYLTLKLMGWSEEQIALDLGISRPTVLRNRRNPSLFTCGDLDLMTLRIKQKATPPTIN